MRYSKVIGAVIFLFCFITSFNAYAGDKPIKKGEPFPDIRLPFSIDAADQEYLGVSGTGDFGIKDIKAQVVVIQIFHSG